MEAIVTTALDTAISPIDRRARLRLPHQPIPTQQPAERICNFDPIYLGYDGTLAMKEAERCLLCPQPAPCMEACPLHNNIPRAMALIAEGDFVGAADVYRETSNMPEICGRVCPQEVLCEGHCVRNARNETVALGKLEMFVADVQRATVGLPPLAKAEPSGRHVGIVGAGPAGLACAEELLKQGHAVTVYEAMPHAGGWLTYGIPAFKLPKSVVDEKVRFLEAMGAQFHYNVRVGRDVTVDSLLEQHDAVFLGTGTWVGAQMEIPGEDLRGVYQATDFLMRANTPAAWLPPDKAQPLALGERVVVVGGGDTAMDCVRSSIRLLKQRGIVQAEQPTVTCYYRRTEAEMPGNKRERKMAREEGAQFEWLTAPVRFIGDETGRVRAMECIRMALGEPDASGRRRPQPVKGSEFMIEVDTVILALGYWPDPTLGETTPQLQTHKYGLIVTDTVTGATSRPGVFAAGDNVTGPDLVVTAVAAARRTARAISAYLLQTEDACCVT